MTEPRAAAGRLLRHLIGRIGDSLTPEEVPFTEAQRVELERRLAEQEHDPDQGISWEEARRRIQGRST